MLGQRAIGGYVHRQLRCDNRRRRHRGEHRGHQAANRRRRTQAHPDYRSRRPDQRGDRRHRLPAVAAAGPHRPHDFRRAGRILADGVHAARQAVPTDRDGFTYQGIGLGGNSMFNGMLFQTNPPPVFDSSWPAGWHWADMQPYLRPRAQPGVPVTNTPSTDGARTTHPSGDDRGPAGTPAPAGWKANTASPLPGRAYTAAPTWRRPKAIARGQISGYFLGVAPGGMPASGLEVLPNSARPIEIDFDTTGAATAVHYTRRTALDQSQAATYPARHNCARVDCW